MKVTNNTSFSVTAFGFDSEIGYGDDVTIPPGATSDVNGPYLGEMGGGSCHIIIEGEVTCHETQDDDKGLQIAKDMPIYLQVLVGRGIAIRHHEDPIEEHVTKWRASQKK